MWKSQNLTKFNHLYAMLISNMCYGRRERMLEDASLSLSLYKNEDQMIQPKKHLEKSGVLCIHMPPIK